MNRIFSADEGKWRFIAGARTTIAVAWQKRGQLPGTIADQTSCPILGHGGYLIEHFVRGVIVVHAGIGRILKKRCSALWRSDVLDCSGEFNAGDRVYVVIRTRDGSQFVVATATTSLDATACRPPRDRAPQLDDVPARIGTNALVIREQDMALRWTASS